MFRQVIAIGMAVLLNASAAGAAAGGATAQTLTGSSLKQQVVLIPAGTVVEVKYLEKGAKKLVGRLGPVTDTGFEMQVADKGTISAQKVAFSEVKSLKAKKGMHPATKGLIIAGVVVGVIGLLAGILVWSGAADQ